MLQLSARILQSLWEDLDLREVRLRQVVTERLEESPPPRFPDQIVATYFLALRTTKLSSVAEEIAYHATCGIRNPTPGSLVAECTGRGVGIDVWDSTGRIGLLHMAYPCKMLVRDDGSLTSCDLLHTVASAIVFDVYENQDCRLVGLNVPESVLATFPGPAYGPFGFREVVGLQRDEPAFGTILKPTAGITPQEVGDLVEQLISPPLLSFVKEDENLYPRLGYSPAAERTRRAIASIERAAQARQGGGIVFAPHITGAPHEILDTVHAVLEAGATGVMFSESFAGGTVRMVREATKHLPNPPLIYGHSAGIGVKTRAIWREVIDYLARLDGIDFRQTAPKRCGAPFIRPYGQEWLATEQVLTEPISGIKPVMISRAGGLDHGNVILNLEDAEQRQLSANILFLAGSAINSIKDSSGWTDPRIGLVGMQQAIEVHRSGAMRGVPDDRHVAELLRIAQSRGMKSLVLSLTYRYGEF